MPYEDFLDKRLFVPLGMKDTTFWPSEEQVKRLAKSYRPKQGQDGSGRDQDQPAQAIRSTIANGSRCRRAACSRRREMSAVSARWC